MMWLAQAKALAHALGPSGTRVNTLSPGGILTTNAANEMKAKADKQNLSFDEYYNQAVANVPLRKYAEPNEIVNTIKFLLSEQSSHITGINLPCDGGFNRGY